LKKLKDKPRPKIEKK